MEKMEKMENLGKIGQIVIGKINKNGKSVGGHKNVSKEKKVKNGKDVSGKMENLIKNIIEMITTIINYIKILNSKSPKKVSKCLKLLVDRLKAIDNSSPLTVNLTSNSSQNYSLNKMILLRSLNL